MGKKRGKEGYREVKKVRQGGVEDVQGGLLDLGRSLPLRRLGKQLVVELSSPAFSEVCCRSVSPSGVGSLR